MAPNPQFLLLKDFLVRSLRLRPGEELAWAERMTRMAAAAFAAALTLTLFDPFLRPSAYASRGWEIFKAAGFIRTGGMYGLTLAGDAAVLLALLSIHRVGPWLAGGWAGACLALSAGWQKVTGRYPLSGDFWVIMHSDSNAFAGAVTAFASPGLMLLVAACLVMGAGLGLAFRWYTRPVGWRASAVCGLGAVLFQFGFWNLMNVQMNDYPASAMANTHRTLVFADIERREFHSIEREEAPPVTSAGRPADNIILILDESVCFDFISPNDPKADVTPVLGRLVREDPRFVNYGLMLAASTCSFATKVLVTTGTTEIPDADRRALRNPTVFDLARAAGYRVMIFDSPGINYPNLAIHSGDLEHVELHRGKSIHKDIMRRDIEAVRQIRASLRERPGAFVFLIKQGAHFHYETSYPRDDPRYSRFQPRMEPGEPFGGDWNRTVNSYRNALSWTVDAFAEELFREPWENTTILWTSDHGQDFFDPTQVLTHCGSTVPMALVPFLTHSTNEWFLANQLPAEFPQAIARTHHELYPTLAALFRKDATITHNGFAALMRGHDPVQPPLRYMYGGIWAQSAVVTLDPAGLLAYWSLERARLPQ